MASQRLVIFAAALAFAPAAGADDGPSRGAEAERAEQPCARDSARASSEGSGGAESEDERFGATGACIDEVIADRLARERARRGAVDRLFVKQARHELSAGGGYYVSDLLGGSFAASGSYTYHMTETTALEFAGAVTYADSSTLRAAQADRADIAGAETERVLAAESLLVWSPLYGKLRLGGEIMRFDLNAAAGFGVVDAPTSRGLSGVLGAGAVLFMTEALALRLDARDRIHRQQLLESSFLVNDISLTFGLSVFFPPGN